MDIEQLAQCLPTVPVVLELVQVDVFTLGMPEMEPVLAMDFIVMF
jgi:hypothetical protein